MELILGILKLNDIILGKSPVSNHRLSDEEDLRCDSEEKCAISLSSNLENYKGRIMPVFSQLEMLRKDAVQLDHGKNAAISSDKRRKALCIEDDIEDPAFNNEGDTVGCLRTASVTDSDKESTHDRRLAYICNSDEEIMSDDERSSLPTVGNVKRYEVRDAWAEANREVEALVQLNENTGPSKVHISSKDSRSKAKPKYLFRFQSQKEDFPLFVGDENEIDMSVTDLPHGKMLDIDGNVDMQNSMAEALDIYNVGEVKQPLNSAIPFGGAVYHDYNEKSVAEFLDSLQDRSDQPLGSCEMSNRLRGRRTQAAVSTNVYPEGDINIQEDSLLNDGSSTDDEGVALHSKPVFQQQTIADRFHEALGAVSPNHVKSEVKFHRQSSIGLFEKLQHVMQTEKERDMNFLESSNRNANSRDRRSHIDVRILSRSLEAKLTVCCCSLVRDEESSQLVNKFHKSKQIGERILTIIFSSRICGDVELEAGNLIRVQPPWKEVAIQVKDEVIILSTYFSQLGS